MSIKMRFYTLTVLKSQWSSGIKPDRDYFEKKINFGTYQKD